MRVGIVGLGRMGHNIALHLAEQGHTVVAHNRSPPAVRAFVRSASTMRGPAIPAHTPDELMDALPSPRVVLLMVPAGKPVDDVLGKLAPRLRRGDIVIDGGNSLYIDSIRRSKSLAKKGIAYLDCGTSGGLSGARNGACLTIGGPEAAYRKLLPLWRAIACEGGFLYCGPSGAGHYVKMVHNGIEYSLLQAYGEGFELLHRAPYRLRLDQIARVWMHGSVIRSWLLELGAQKLRADPRMDKPTGRIGGGETGRWTLSEAGRRRVRMPALLSALAERKRSEKADPLSGRFIAYVRNGFGGHEIVWKKKPAKKKSRR